MRPRRLRDMHRKGAGYEGMDYNELAKVGAELGSLLIQYGAEIYRAEESMVRLFAAYGAQESQVFALTTCINVTVFKPGGEPVTRISRVQIRTFDLDKIDRLNDLCRRACAQYIPLWRLERALKHIEMGKVFSRPLQAAGLAGVAFAFALFFGGGLEEAAVSGLTGLAIFAIQELLNPFRPNLFFSTLLQSLCIGVLCIGGSYFFPGFQRDIAIIGAVMNLVPGIAITSFIRDLLSGDYLSGALRFMESMIVAGAIALGVGIVLFLTQLF